MRQRHPGQAGEADPDAFGDFRYKRFQPAVVLSQLRDTLFVVTVHSGQEFYAVGKCFEPVIKSSIALNTPCRCDTRRGLWLSWNQRVECRN